MKNIFIYSLLTAISTSVILYFYHDLGMFTYDLFYMIECAHIELPKELKEIVRNFIKENSLENELKRVNGYRDKWPI